MTEKRKIQILFVITLILVVVWVVGIFTSPRARLERQQSEPLAAFPWETLRAIQIDGLAIDGSDSAQWIVREEGVPARNDRVEQLIGAFREASRIRMVASRQEELETFGLDDPHTLVISGDAELTLSFGDTISGAREVFVSIKGEDPVFATTDDLSFYFRQTPIYWKDIRLFPEDPDLASIQRITITDSGENSFSLTKFFNEASNSSEWVFTDGESADFEKADGFVRSFFRFEARDVVKSTDLTDEHGKIILSDGSQSFHIAVYSAPPSLEGEPQFYLMPSGLRSEYVFLVTESVKNRILRTKDHFVIVDTEASVEN